MTRISPTQTSGAPVNQSDLSPGDTFPRRHIGPCDADLAAMLESLGYQSMDALLEETIPAAIRVRKPLVLAGAQTTSGAPRGEHETLAELAALGAQNQVWRSFIGMGYHGTITPSVVGRNVLEDPAWYTAYTPYQAEIAQGRLEALLAFQTMVAELTGLPLAGASLLDEGTAAAEAMSMCVAISGNTALAAKLRFFVADDCNPQTIAVVRTRATGLGIELVVGTPSPSSFDGQGFCGVLLSYPTTDGRVERYGDLAKHAHAAGAQVVVVCDVLALCLLATPASWGADIAVGSTQRFGVPMGFGGPHAAFIATRTEHARRIPGRIIGLTRDAHGNPALRMAIQTREQHIKRERATSNICTSQVLLAVMAAMYAAYHGPAGLRRIAERVHGATNCLAASIRALGGSIVGGAWFDTIRVRVKDPSAVLAAAAQRQMNLRSFADGTIGVALDETVRPSDLADLVACMAAGCARHDATVTPGTSPLSDEYRRHDAFLSQPVFNTHHSETQMLRYLQRLASRDLSLCHSMIPLGSCTMKLNASSEMAPITWPSFAALHPFAPETQWRGWAKVFSQLESWLSEITGFAACSLQPNAGSQGEYAGLMAIHAYHRARGDHQRDICLIPESAHGTNPASAVVAGMRVVVVACLEHGDIDLADLKAKSTEHAKCLAALMVTYPSTHGVFEEGIAEICRVVHAAGGLVYMDGANMNAQVGLTRPGDIGADVCHLNLHKTFCIPHGGGGPGMGPICCTSALAPFLPSHPVVNPTSAGAQSIGPVSAAPHGSAAILLISWMYIAMMGPKGLRRATEVAILNANYMAARLAPHYPVLFANQKGRCAHEFIIDCRMFEKSAGIKVDDIAKRLMDYGFHAPTMSFPVPGTLMIEPTESESRAECDRLCEALISIRGEIRAIEEGLSARDDNPLKGAPHTAAAVSATEWKHGYTRELAAWPAPWLKEAKFWPAVGRIDNPYGDRNLICTCDSVRAYA